LLPSLAPPAPPPGLPHVFLPRKKEERLREKEERRGRKKGRNGERERISDGRGG